MSSPPDLSSLSLSSQRLNDHADYSIGGSGNVGGGSYFPSAPPMQGPFATMGASPLKSRPSRAGLPSQWIDAPPMPEGRPLSPHNTDLSSLSSGGGSPPPLGAGLAQLNAQHGMSVPAITTPQPDDEIIPTAIVIKNIPFNVKRETLLDIIASLAIPTPYAFNYHLDQSGQFRGLAFANFRQSGDADAVVAALNGFDVQGRKLRVEYKKVLQAGEKERIEREKALRRMRSMQLEKEQQNAIAAQTQYDDYGTVIQSTIGTAPAFTPQRSFSGGLPPWGAPAQQPVGTPQTYSPPPPMPPMPHMGSYSSVNALGTPGVGGSPPSAQRPTTPGASIKSTTELDLNDPATLEIYSRILLFKDDPMRDELAFSRTLSAKQRRVVHLVAQKLGVYHYSVGEGEERYAVVTRINPETHQAPPPRLSRAPSAYHLSAAAAAQQASPSLRMKKSMPDIGALRSAAQAPRLNTRVSNSNIREGFATIASPARRSPGTGLSGLFAGFGPGTVPPVPTLPASVAAMNGGGLVSPGGLESPIVRQPRGPGATMGFSARRDKAPEGGKGLEARSHEPLEI